MREKTKIVVDVCLIFGVFLSMSLHSCGPGVHKIAGMFTFILFIVHNILNRGWYRGLLSGEYTISRIAYTITNIVVIISMIGIVLSGVMLSKEMHSASTAAALTDGRILHLVSSYVSCAAIVLHIVFHLISKKENEKS